MCNFIEKENSQERGQCGYNYAITNQPIEIWYEIGHWDYCEIQPGGYLYPVVFKMSWMQIYVKCNFKKRLLIVTELKVIWIANDLNHLCIHACHIKYKMDPVRKALLCI